ncbi:MAG TPA: hypothetical protein VFO77_10320 [Actinoplanes sp.]|nr:hypothetical protein [Actinoplanes sp.]
MRRALAVFVAAVAAAVTAFTRLPAVVSIGVALDVPPEPFKRELASSAQGGGSGACAGRIVHITI